MGRLVIPIGIDIETVKTVFGSKDEALYNKLLDSGFFKKFDEEFSFKTELYDIIFNYIPLEKRIIKPAKLFGFIKGNDGRGLDGEWNDYAYALLTICCYLGEKFSGDDKEFVYGESWWQINTSLRENSSSFDLSRMLESNQIFDTPFEYSDIYTNSYNKEEVVEFISHILNMEKNIKSENLPLFNSLKKGLVNCRDNNFDLIIFSYEI
jgi:hypothetical protein